MHLRWINFFWLHLAVMLAATSLAGCYNEASQYRDLLSRYKNAVGTVRSLNCPNHGAVTYKFEVDGQTHVGLAEPGVLDCDRVVIGDPVQVYYDPLKPSTHTLLDPRELYEQERGYHVPIWLAFVIGFPLFLLLQVVLHFGSVRMKDWSTNASDAHKDEGKQDDA